MSGILTAVVLVVAIGLIVGLVLAVASILMAVPVDEKAVAIEEQLPGANCGACGFSGCSGYAAALSKGEAKLGLCSVGGQAVADAIAPIIGADSVETIPQTAVVHCNGSDDNTSKGMRYQGIESCLAATQLYAGMGDCSYGCIGFGDCMKACEYNAITVCNGVAAVNSNLCRACGACVKACPKGLIRIEPKKPHAVVKCSNCDKGALTRKSCKVGCIGCMKCVKVCENGAVKVENFHAIIDPDKCTGCGKCAEGCPQSIIEMMFV
ncbi:MAG: RnfABCDGE type electron transport complex subunit B [Lachnospiraceae bacterium]|nr:RnfABCDGE type electron transport complex subunit B [Lachnospiraceae bacterium]